MPIFCAWILTEWNRNYQVTHAHTVGCSTGRDLKQGIGPSFGRETLHSKAVHYIYVIEQIYIKKKTVLFCLQNVQNSEDSSYSLVYCLCWIINRSFTFHISSSKSLLFLYFALCYISDSQPFFNITLPIRCLFRHFLLT